MFTGLVEETAKVESVSEAGEGKRIVLEKVDSLKDNSEGASVSISGACLTIEKITEDNVQFFLAEETLEKTWFDRLEEGDFLNIEEPLKPNDKMGGHYVQGHVDRTSEIKSIEELEEGWNITFTKPNKLSQFIVSKGFITVEGISLTVSETDEDSFSVTIIPETWKRTNLSEKSLGDKVNLEVDIMAKYAQEQS